MARVSTIIALTFALGVAGAVSCAAQNWHYLTAYPSFGFLDDMEMSVDTVGNVFVTGSQVQPNAGADSAHDIVVAKYDRYGSRQWMFMITGPGDDRAGDIVASASGDVYVTGSFEREATCGGSLMRSRGGKDVFVASVSEFNGLQLLRTFGGTGNDVGRGISIDVSGRGVAVVGGFEGMVAFGDDTLAAIGGSDAFIARMAGTNVIWAQSGGGEGEDCAVAVDIDRSNNAYVAGTCTASARFSFFAIPDSLYYDRTGFLVKYDLGGAPRSAAIVRASSDRRPLIVSADREGNAFVASTFRDTITVNRMQLVSAGERDVYLARFSASGDPMWATSDGTSYDDELGAMAADPVGNGFIAATHNDPSGERFSIRKIDRYGVRLWMRESNPGGTKRLAAIEIGANGYAYVGGVFTDTLRLGSLQRTTPRGTRAMMIAQLSPDASVAIVGLTGARYCAGASIDVQIQPLGSYFNGNVFMLELSDTVGSFDAPIAIGSSAAAIATEVRGVLPATLPSGSRYRLRVVSSNPRGDALDNGGDLTIDVLPHPALERAGDSICLGDTMTIDAGPGYARYFWSTGATSRSIAVTRAGTYWARVITASGCSGVSDSAVIVATQPPAKPMIEAFFGGLRTASGFRTQWYRDGVAIDGATSSTLESATPGAYTVRIINEEGCDATSDEFVVSASAIDHRDEASEPSIVDRFESLEVRTATNDRGPLSLSITDASGRIVYSVVRDVSQSNASIVLALPRLPHGVFVARVSCTGATMHHVMIR